MVKSYIRTKETRNHQQVPLHVFLNLQVSRDAGGPSCWVPTLLISSSQTAWQALGAFKDTHIYSQGHTRGGGHNLDRGLREEGGCGIRVEGKHWLVKSSVRPESSGS